ncbi:small polypeptide DEVIL 21-like [Lotus japonicus]|nr:small polypeptide DEVIL 21-like [Lotus japonicus]
MGRMGRRFSKLRRMVRQQRGKLYIMRVCITMLLNWHKYS